MKGVSTIDRYYRLDGESDDELIYRICSEKDLIGTWNDVANIINSLTGFTFGESAYRKKYQSFQKLLTANEKKFANNETQLENIRSERYELEKEKVRVRDEKNDLRRMIREQARKEGYLDLIARCIQEYQAEPLEYEQDKQFRGVLKTDNDLIVSLTDIHAGIEIDTYFNQYNSTILKNRLNKYLDKIFEVQLRHGSENVYVILSELISGLIHNELRIESNQNVIEQFLMVANYISQFLAQLSYYFNEVHVYVCPGNHSRLHERKEDSVKGENIDHLAIPFLEAKLQNYNINFHRNSIEESVAMFNVRGNIIMASHGDKDDISSVVQKFTMLFHMQPNMIYLGHRHTNSMTTIYDTKVIQSGCLSGSDNYCLDKRLKNKPEQTISVVTNDGLDCLYDVKFE